MYNPVQIAESLKAKVIRNKARKYYRLVRGGNRYGGVCRVICK